MITEDYVSFEIAKLLKEKGFDGESHKHYWGYEPGKEFLTEGSFNPEYDYVAPTLQIDIGQDITNSFKYGSLIMNGDFSVLHMRVINKRIE